MSATMSPQATLPRDFASPRDFDEPVFVKYLLLSISIGFLFLFLIVPLAAIFVEAFRKGIALYWTSVTNAHALSAIKLTLFTAAVAVPLNTLFGLAAAWAITKHHIRFKSLLVSLIDLPFAVSPVISGLIYVLLFGGQSWFGGWLATHQIQIIFATPGIVLATLFVSFPFVARELIPLMEEQGTEEEEAAMMLGANGWQTFWRVTVPNIRWALLYGIVLTNARVMGEFGAVSVVSGHVRGKTNTIPLHVEILYNEYNFVAAFAVASLLGFLAIVTLVAKSLLEDKKNSANQSRQLESSSTEEL